MTLQNLKHQLHNTALTGVIFFALFLFMPISASAAPSSPAKKPGLWEHYSLFSIVKALAFDGDVLWIGTTNGLLKYDLRKETQKVYTTKDGLLSNMIHTITVSPKGEPWIGTYGGGLSHFDGKRWTAYTPYGVGSSLTYSNNWTNYKRGRGLGDLWVYGIHFDPKGTMWVATWKGVSRFDGSGFLTFTTDDGLIDKWVYTLSQDKKGVFWFGTEGGVTRYDGKTWKSYTNKDGVGAKINSVKPPETQSLPYTPRHHERGGGKPLDYNPNYISASVVDDKNTLWIGTLGGGLSRFDGQSWKSFTTKEGLSGNLIHAITIDAQGTLWIGTDGGVSRFDGKQFLNLTDKDGIGAVFSIAIDRRGNKWFGTFGGVSQYRGK